MPMQSLGGFVQLLKPKPASSRLQPKATMDEKKSPVDALKAKAKCSKEDKAAIMVDDAEETKNDDPEGHDDGQTSKLVFEEEAESEDFEVEKDDEPVGDKVLATQAGDDGAPTQDDHDDAPHADDHDDAPADAHDEAVEQGEEEEPADDDDDEEVECDDKGDPALQELHQKEHQEDEEERAKLKGFVEKQSARTVPQKWWSPGGWTEWNRNRNKGKGQKGGYHKNGHHKGWNDWKWTHGKGGHSKWGKWHYGHGDWDWDNSKGSKDAHDRGGDLLTPDSKGQGYYLPGGQGYLDKDGKFHPYLGCICAQYRFVMTQIRQRLNTRCN